MNKFFIFQVLLNYKTKYDQQNEIVLECGRKTGFIYPLIAASALGHIDIVRLLLTEERRQKTRIPYRFQKPQDRSIEVLTLPQTCLDGKTHISTDQQCEVIHECPLKRDVKVKPESGPFRRLFERRTDDGKTQQDQDDGILRDRLGMTALHWAAKEGYLDIVTLLHTTYGKAQFIEP